MTDDSERSQFPRTTIYHREGLVRRRDHGKPIRGLAASAERGDDWLIEAEQFDQKHLVGGRSNSPTYSQFNSEWGLSRIRHEQPGAPPSQEAEFEDFAIDQFHLGEKSTGFEFLLERVANSRQGGLDRGNTSFSDKNVSSLLCSPVFREQEEIGDRSESTESSLPITNISSLRGLISGACIGDIRDDPLVCGPLQSVLPSELGTMATKVDGVTGSRQVLQVASVIPWPELCPTRFYDGNPRTHSLSSFMADSNSSVHRRLPRCFSSSFGRATGEGDSSVAQEGRFFPQLGGEIMSDSVPQSSSSWVDNQCPGSHIRDSSGENQGYSHIGPFSLEDDKLSSRFTRETDWQDHGCGKSLESVPEILVGYDRLSPAVLSIEQFGSFPLGQLEETPTSYFACEGGYAHDLQNTAPSTVQDIQTSTATTGFHRCCGESEPWLGISYSSHGDIWTRNMDNNRESTLFFDPSERAVRSVEGDAGSPMQQSDMSRHRQQDCPEMGGFSRWQEERTGSNDSPFTPNMGGLSKKRGDNRKSRLDSRIEQLSRGCSLPITYLFKSRSDSTMDRDGKLFDNWMEWLREFGLRRSPDSLWLYLDSLGGKSSGRYARQIRSGILAYLKISGEYYSSPGSLSYGDERLKQLAIGVEKSIPFIQKKPPKLPVRWYHLNALATLQNHDQFWLRDTCIFLVGLFALLRANEFSSISTRDFTFEEDGTVLLRFMRSKTDLDSVVTEIRITNLSGFGFHLTDTLKQFVVQARESGVEGLFASSNGLPLTASSLTTIISQRMAQLQVQGKFSSHALRVGGACFAAERGLSEPAIKALGGWKSNSFLRYIRDVEPTFHLQR